MLHIPILRAGIPYRSLDTARLCHLGSGEPVAPGQPGQQGTGGEGPGLRGGEPARPRRPLGGAAAGNLRGSRPPVHGGGPARGRGCPGAGGLRAPDLGHHGSPRNSLPRQHGEDSPGALADGCGAGRSDARAPPRGPRRRMGPRSRAPPELHLPDPRPGGGAPQQFSRGALSLGPLDRAEGPGDAQTRQGRNPGRRCVLPGLSWPRAVLPGHSDTTPPIMPEPRKFYCAAAVPCCSEATPRVESWAGDSRVQIHGPGRSKIILGADEAESWEDHLDLMVASVAENGGRSCINASGIWVPDHGLEIATALAQRLARIEALPLDHPQAQVAAFARPEVALRLSELDRRPARDGGARRTLPPGSGVGNG